MKLLKVTYAYFSIGHSTEKVLARICDSFRDYAVEAVDLTRYENRQRDYNFTETDLLVLGVPSYGGRVPVPVIECLPHFAGINTPVVLVATYGNRDIDDTLMELYKNVIDKGFIPVAAAGFVCQHTFLKKLAGGRPDEKDLAVAKEFGDKLKERLRLLVTYDVKDLQLPGSFPYKKPPMKLPFQVETNEYCIYCMLCADACPVKAISDQNPMNIDNGKCIRCGSCISVCPTQAKSFTKEPFEKVQGMLSGLIGVHKDPWYVIG